MQDCISDKIHQVIDGFHKAINEEVYLIIDEYGILVEAIDPLRIALGRYRAKYPKTFSKIRRYVILPSGIRIDKPHIKICRDTLETSFQHTTLDNFDPINTSKIEENLHNKAVVVLNDFKKILNGLSATSNYIQLLITQNQAAISDPDTGYTLPVNETIRLVEGEGGRITLNIDILTKIMRYTPHDKVGTLHFQGDMPIKITLFSTPRKKLEIFIAQPT